MTNVIMERNEPGSVNQPSGLKILMLTWEFPPNVVGGLSKHVFGLSKRLSQIGVEVYVITAAMSGLPEYELMENIHVYRVKPLNEQDDHFLTWIGGLNLAIAYKGMELGNSIQFSIVHAHDWLVGAVATILKESLNLPLLTTIHATEFGRNNGIHNEMQQFIHEREKRLTYASDQIIVCSEYMLQEIVPIFEVTKEKIAIIPNGIEDVYKRAEEMPHSKTPARKDKKLIFSIGRIVKEKGFETLIKAASVAKETNLNIFFVIAGKGPMLENFRRQVQERYLEDYISFIGYISDEEKNVWMCESDMNVFPSLYEPFGIVALESMIHGKPTIVSDVGGLKGIVKHMESGLFMLPGKTESLLEQISFLLKNPKKAQEIGEKGQQIVKNLYGWNRVAAETKRVMEDLVILSRIRSKK